MLRRAILAALALTTIVSAQEPQPVLPAAVTMPKVPADAAKIRAAIQMPRDGLRITFSDRNGRIRFSDPKSIRENDVQAILAKLKGGPDDDQMYVALCEAYLRADENEKAQECAKKAAELTEKRWRASPKDPAICRDLGRALFLSGDLENSWSRLEESLKAAPEDWQALCYLSELSLEWADGLLSWDLERFGEARFLVTKKDGVAIVTFQPSKMAPSLEKMFKTIDEDPPPPTTLEQVERLVRAAEMAANRAVACAPNEPTTYYWRSHLAVASATTKGRLALFRKDEATARAFAVESELAGYSDLFRAFDCQPRNPDNAIFEWAETCAQNRTTVALGNEKNAAVAKEREVQALFSATARLEALSRSPDHTVASRAAVYLGLLARGAAKDMTKADKWARLALELDPEFEAAWLLRAEVSPENAPDYESFCGTAVRHFDCREYRACLAAAYAGAGKTEKAEAEIRKAIASDPKDILAHLQLAALFLRTDVKDWLAKFDVELGEAERLIIECRGSGELRRCATALRAARFALNGDASTARTLLEGVFAEQETCEIARLLLAALPERPK